jgi:hypothetical protein
MKRFNKLLLVAIFAGLLAACGGGGGGNSSVSVGPSAVSYEAFTLDSIAGGSLSFDDQGRLRVGDEVYALADTSTTLGCTFGSIPATATSTVETACNRLPAGAGYLLCDDTTGATFGLALLGSGVVPATRAELGTTTLTALSCGAQGIRTVDGAVKFVDLGFFDDTPAPGTIWGPGTYDAIFSNAGTNYRTDGQHKVRYVIRKKITGATTTFFVLRLFENVSGSGVILDSKIYSASVTQ